ncbi:MAG: ACT domain-containing protein [Acidimicrobiia bacterium]|nr:ACT domain-containing protein [Acidimicrobiia bacterium]
MARFTVAAVGADRPGIVAAVSAALVGAGCNLEDSSMTILGGQFAILLVLTAPVPATEASITGALDAAAREFDLAVSVRAVPAGTDADAGPGAVSAGWTVAVYGADHPGIVHAVARLLADAGVNIVDLNTRVIGPATAPVYAMTLDVALPPGLDPASLAADLEVLSGEIGVDTSLHASQADIL